MPELAWLDDSQTLTYLHATVSTRRYRVGVPEVTIPLVSNPVSYGEVHNLFPFEGLLAVLSVQAKLPHRRTTHDAHRR